MVAKKTAGQHSATSSSPSDATTTGDRAVRQDRPMPVTGAPAETSAEAPATTTSTTTTSTTTSTSTTATTGASASRQHAAGPSAGPASRPAKRTPGRPAPRAPAKRAPAGPAGAKEARAGKAAVERTTAGRKGAVDEAVASAAEGAARAADKTGATTVAGKKTPGPATAAQQPTAVPKARPGAVAPEDLPVRPGEDPWTQEEVDEARAELTAEALRLRNEIESSEQSLAGLMRDSGDGAGDDQADTGTKNITREHELALAANAREMLIQTERALERLHAGTYGLCEVCGNAIGKARMQAFPRATLCVEDKQKQERR